MKRNSVLSCTALIIALGVAGATPAFSGEGSGKIKIGFVLVDEEGDGGVNQETFNTYEGAALSLAGFRYGLKNGILIDADLNNITLNNRNLRASASKPGLFGVSLTNNQYRRSYGSDGSDFTRRRATGATAYVLPARGLKLFGGYSTTEKHGEKFGVASAIGTLISDTSVVGTDYVNNSLNFGAQAFSRKANLRLEYRRADFDDKTGFDRDREGNSFLLNLYSTVPSADWLSVSGGFRVRKDEYLADTTELKTNLFWAGTKANFARFYTLEYRIMTAATSHTSDTSDNDNMINTLTLTRRFPGWGGLRVGYESRVADDGVDKTGATGILLSSWFNYQRRLFLKGRMTLRDEEVKDGLPYLGNEEFNRYLLSARYVGDGWGDVSVRWDNRTRKFDINSASAYTAEADYNAVTGELNLQDDQYGRAVFIHSYYLGKFDYHDDQFEFSDHLFTGTLYPKEYKDINLSVGGTYYRSRRDVDVEKFAVNVGASYRFLKDHYLEVKYNAYNFDDFLAPDRYYTGNIVEVNISKDLTL